MRSLGLTGSTSNTRSGLPLLKEAGSLGPRKQGPWESSRTWPSGVQASHFDLDVGAGDPHRIALDLSSRRRPHDSPGLDGEPRPVPGAGHLGSLDRPFGQRPSSMGARIAQRVERFSHPKEGELLAFHFDQLGLLVFQLIGRGHLHEFGHRPFLLWVGAVFARFFLQPLPPGSPASVLRRAGLDPGVVDEELLVQRDEVFRLFRRLVLGEDRLHRAHGLAGPAVDALVGVDEELVRPLVDAVNWADLDAGLVLDVDARLDDHVRHRISPLYRAGPASFGELWPAHSSFKVGIWTEG